LQKPHTRSVAVLGDLPMSGMSWIIYILVALILIIIISRRVFEQAKRKTEILAAENGLRLVEFRSTLGAGRHTASFRFTVSDKHGKSKTGKIRFQMTLLFGVSDPEVFWDDENS
jgi:hypothetical protein